MGKLLDKLKKKAKIDEKLEPKLIEWVNKALEKGSDMKQIKNRLSEKYGEVSAAKFIKRNYAIEPSDIELPETTEEMDNQEVVKKESKEVDDEIKKLKLEAEGKDLPPEPPKETIKETIKEEDEINKIQDEIKKEPKKEEKELKLEELLRYEIETFNLRVSQNNSLLGILKELSEIKGILKKK